MKRENRGSRAFQFAADAVSAEAALGFEISDTRHSTGPAALHQAGCCAPIVAAARIAASPS